ncbi:MAG: hypothetical protein FJX30_06460 [Alphaproteobacteria bacterium]|nr:hypothetical protein [Alphaproteobacteria bacterium]
MFKKIIIVFVALFLASQNAFAVELWNSENGISRLDSSKYKNDFYQLANFFQPQINPVLCSSATALMIKNSLFYNQISSQNKSEIIKPDGQSIAFNLYVSQEDFFNSKTESIKTKEAIFYKQKTYIKKADGTTIIDFDPGTNLGDFAKMLNIHQIKTKIFYQKKFDEQELSSLRTLLKKILIDKTQFLIVNFDGKVFGNKTNGHISPVVAFDENSDSVLVLDVALHKNPWYWVDLKDLVKAMNTMDGNQYRGYLIVSK